MNKEIADRWVVALRSGNYQQGKNKLKTSVNGEIKHCCLGVLCEIQGVDFTHESQLGQYSIDGWTGSIPESVRSLCDIKTRDGTLPTNQLLSTLNDQGKTFLEIADVIEKNYEYL